MFKCIYDSLKKVSLAPFIQLFLSEKLLELQQKSWSWLTPSHDFSSERRGPPPMPIISSQQPFSLRSEICNTMEKIFFKSIKCTRVYKLRGLKDLRKLVKFTYPALYYFKTGGGSLSQIRPKMVLFFLSALLRHSGWKNKPLHLQKEASGLRPLTWVWSFRWVNSTITTSNFQVSTPLSKKVLIFLLNLKFFNFLLKIKSLPPANPPQKEAGWATTPNLGMIF